MPSHFYIIFLVICSQIPILVVLEDSLTMEGFAGLHHKYQNYMNVFNLPTWLLNHWGFMLNGGLKFKMWGFLLVFRYGRQAWELIKKWITIRPDYFFSFLLIYLTRNFQECSNRAIAISEIYIWTHTSEIFQETGIRAGTSLSNIYNITFSLSQPDVELCLLAAQHQEH